MVWHDFKQHPVRLHHIYSFLLGGPLAKDHRHFRIQWGLNAAASGDIRQGFGASRKGIGWRIVESDPEKGANRSDSVRFAPVLVSVSISDPWWIGQWIGRWQAAISIEYFRSSTRHALQGTHGCRGCSPSRCNSRSRVLRRSYLPASAHSWRRRA